MKRAMLLAGLAATLILTARPWIGWGGVAVGWGLMVVILVRSRPARRWTDADLAAERQRIEAKHRDGATLAPRELAEYLVQRYGAQLVAGTTQAKYARTIRRLAATGEAARKKPAAPFVPYTSPNAGDTQVTRYEFFRYVVPHVRLLGYWPEGHGDEVDAAVAEDLWEWSGALEAGEMERALFAMWAHLNLDARFTARAVQAALASFRQFKACLEHRYSAVRVCTGPYFCGESLPDEIAARDMALAYRAPDRDALIVPFPRCPLNGRDGGGLCGCRIDFGWAPLREGDDPEFEAWFRDHVRRGR